MPDTNPNVHFCSKCEDEHGGGIADLGDNACSICGRHDAPHVYLPQATLAAQLEAADRLADAWNTLNVGPFEEQNSGKWSSNWMDVVDAEDAYRALRQPGEGK